MEMQVHRLITIIYFFDILKASVLCSRSSGKEVLAGASCHIVFCLNNVYNRK